MPNIRKFSVTLNPTFRSRYGGGLVTVHTIGLGRDEDPTPRKAFEASTVTEVLGVVSRFAAERPERSCHAYVRILEGRKPPGFDAAVLGLYFHDEKATFEHEEAA